MHNIELDRWAATKMEYPIGSSLWLNFHPSTNLNQCFLLANRMAEDGWYLSLDQSMVPPFEWTAQFFSEVHTHPVGLGVQADDPCEAIILAARATEQEGK